MPWGARSADAIGRKTSGRTARAVTEVRTDELRIAERRPVLALFDGEPEWLEPGTRITVGRTKEQFVSTRDDQA